MVGTKKHNFSLSDCDVTIECIDELLKHATGYHKELFGPAPSNMYHLANGLWAPNEN